MVNEHDAYKVIGHIPVFNFFYSGIRAAVYAGQGNITEAHRSGIGMIPFAHTTRETAPMIAAKAIEEGKKFALAALKTKVRGLVAVITSFCVANPWLVGGVVVAVVVAVVVFIIWRRSKGKAKEKKQDEKIRIAVETAVRAVTERLQNVVVGEESLRAMIAAQIEAEKLRGDLG